MFLVAAFEGNMSGNEHAFLEDLDRVGEHVNVEDATAGRIGDAVEIATDATMPSCETRRSSFKTALYGTSGNGFNDGFSSAKVSLTTRCVVACNRAPGVQPALGQPLRNGPDSTLVGRQSVRAEV